MNGRVKHVRDLILAVACGLTVLSARPTFASDASGVNAIVEKFVADINKGDFSSVAAACAPHASIVDGFPPYAWQTCADWMRDYQSNNKATHATLGILSFGKPLWTDVQGSYAYVTYPVTFTNTQRGKKYSYKGTMAVALHKTQSGWIFTGVASAWTL